MGFWVDWELWEKMCFVIVLAYGTGVQIYNTWRIKRMAATEMQLISQRDSATGLKRTKDDDVPFGSRAIESGIEVEGIWISNHSTPRRSPQSPGTPEEARPSSQTSSQFNSFPRRLNDRPHSHNSPEAAASRVARQPQLGDQNNPIESLARNIS
ncbi:hypothetical protein PRK78_007114 [Emydomyces testavorans]|uniref:Uncharacterized protein n=1 Tax=Emydomyces testavorans TaxID=2070801 RepID=A0AAF0DNH5_9EURO|nr:hypothetical protein PRK78_007114 [Emydomyces testavorans]